MILLFVLISSQLHAATLTLETERGHVHIPEIPKWELGKNMFGMPFLYFSPQENGVRSNISFTSTGHETDGELNRLSENPESYKKIKSKWAESVAAKAVEFYPYKKWKNDHGHVVHEVGFSFLHESKHYIEKSFYVDCRGKVIFSKTMRLKDNENHEKDFRVLLNDMDCGA